MQKHLSKFKGDFENIEQILATAIGKRSNDDRI